MGRCIFKIIVMHHICCLLIYVIYGRIRTEQDSALQTVLRYPVFVIRRERMKNVENTHIITSKIAYLIGVEKRLFESEEFSFQIDIYQEMNRIKVARIIRHLSRIRSSVYKRFAEIDKEMRFNLKTIETLPEYIPVDSIKQLRLDGIVLYRANCQLERYIIDINRLIIEHIGDCRALFPLWINWDYIRDLFVFKNGLTTSGNKEASRLYHLYYSWYPFQQFINWNPRNCGSLLYHDRKFITILYEMNGDSFQDVSNVTDATPKTKNEIYQFLEESQNNVLDVDSENSDPYKVYAMLSNLDDDSMESISRIILFDDIHTTPAWKILEKFIRIPIEYRMISRVKQDKSLVDISMTSGICQAFYKNHADSFILCASDSDYWGLINVLQEARFLVCVEEQKCGPDIKNAMRQHGVCYCFLDDFYTGLNDKLKVRVLQDQISEKLKAYQFNINDLLKEAYWETHIDMSRDEKERFYNQYIKRMSLKVNKDGVVSIELDQK